MNSFIDTLKQGAPKEWKNDTASLEDREINIIEEYGSFLNNIPDSDQMGLAYHFMSLMYAYREEETIYCIPDEINEVLIDKGLTLRPRKKNELTNSIKKDLQKAKNFRATLESQEEYFKDIPDELIKQAILFGHDETPYFKMVNLIDDYIHDLETKNFKMAHKHKYLSTPPKPNKEPIKEFLYTIAKHFNIATKKEVNNLVSELL